MQACFACLTTRTMRCVKMEVARSGEAVVGENDGDEGNEVDVEEIQRINNTENDIQEAVTNVMLEYSEGIYC